MSWLSWNVDFSKASAGVSDPLWVYIRNGRSYVRSYQQFVHNPRTQRQQAHRSLFKAEVQLASTMRWAVMTTLRDAARQRGMTPFNLFVHLNQQAFSLEEGVFMVDWSRLTLTDGEFPCMVDFGTPQWSADNVLTVPFTPQRRAGLNGLVQVYVYCPETGENYLSAPVYVSDCKVAFAMPEWMAGCEVQVYGLQGGDRYGWSETVYLGSINEECGMRNWGRMPMRNQEGLLMRNQE